MERTDYAQYLRDRTQNFAVTIISLYRSLSKSEVNRLIGRQLLKAASSVGANYRAVCRARSDAESFAKLSIVVEEADETLF
jgi:four helix bundle protein